MRCVASAVRCHELHRKAISAMQWQAMHRTPRTLRTLRALRVLFMPHMSHTHAYESLLCSAPELGA